VRARPRTTFRMDAVLDRDATLRQEKILRMANAGTSSQEKEFDDCVLALLTPSPLRIECMEIKLLRESRAPPISQDEPQH
jgi:hypothetical protein